MRKTSFIPIFVLTLVLAWSSPNLVLADDDDEQEIHEVLEDLDDAEEEKILEFMQENFPRRYRKIMKMKNRHPKKFRQHLKGDAPRFRRLQFMKETNPQEYGWQVDNLKQEVECKELAEKYIKATDAEKPEIKARLKKKLETVFDLRLKHQQQRVERVEKKLTRMRRHLDKREKNRDKIIEKRLEVLLSESDDLTW